MAKQYRQLSIQLEKEQNKFITKKSNDLGISKSAVIRNLVNKEMGRGHFVKGGGNDES